MSASSLKLDTSSTACPPSPTTKRIKEIQEAQESIRQFQSMFRLVGSDQLKGNTGPAQTAPVPPSVENPVKKPAAQETPAPQSAPEQPSAPPVKTVTASGRVVSALKTAAKGAGIAVAATAAAVAALAPAAYALAKHPDQAPLVSLGMLGLVALAVGVENGVNYLSARKQVAQQKQ